MKLPVTSTKLMWFAVLGSPVAWAVQFVVNLYMTWAQCNAAPGRYQIPVHSIQIGLSAAAVAVCLLSMGLCTYLYVHTNRPLEEQTVGQIERQGEGADPPLGRTNFMSMVGLCVGVLSLAIIVMTGVGGPLLPICQQS